MSDSATPSNRLSLRALTTEQVRLLEAAEALRNALTPLVEEILFRKPYRRMELYRLAVKANAVLSGKEET